MAGAQPARAQSSAQGSQQNLQPLSPQLSSLDTWIMQRYRGAQLLPDSVARNATQTASSATPRIESSLKAGRRDSVVALHFNTAIWRATLATGAVVQLADPTGVTTAIGGRVSARRAFRTPRKAGARDTVKDDWRIGWAYLVAVPAKSANAAVSGFDGWLLTEAPRNKPPLKATR